MSAAASALPICSQPSRRPPAPLNGTEHVPQGLPPGIPTWGNLMTQAENYMTSNPVLVIAPGLVVTLTVVAVFFIGDALRDALDVRSR